MASNVLFIRGPNGEIFYDLTDEEWRQIKATKNNWQIVRSAESEVLFARFKQASQVEPDRDYRSDIFNKFLIRYVYRMANKEAVNQLSVSFRKGLSIHLK
jgi:hypothetical protein